MKALADYPNLTASVNFCEPNYFLTPTNAEPWNAYSSFIITAFGIIGGIYNNPNKEWRVFFMYFLLGVVGVGSFCLHSTLKAWGQATDEVPMLLLSWAVLYSMLEVNAPLGKSTYPYLPMIIITLAGAQVAIYFMFRDFYAAFIISYAVMVIIIIIQSAYLILYQNKKPGVLKLRKRMWCIGMSSYVIIGFFLWAYEMWQCDFLLPYYQQAYGASFHILWHIGAGAGTYICITLLTVVRMQCLIDMERKRSNNGISNVISSSASSGSGGVMTRSKANSSSNNNNNDNDYDNNEEGDVQVHQYLWGFLPIIASSYEQQQQQGSSRGGKKRD